MLAIILAQETPNGLIMLMGMIGFSTYGASKWGLRLLPVMRSPEWSRRLGLIALLLGIAAFVAAAIFRETCLRNHGLIYIARYHYVPPRAFMIITCALIAVGFFFVVKFALRLLPESPAWSSRVRRVALILSVACFCGLETRHYQWRHHGGAIHFVQYHQVHGPIATPSVTRDAFGMYRVYTNNPTLGLLDRPVLSRPAKH